MSGITKKKYIAETMRYNKSIKRPLNLIAEVMPKEYNGRILLQYFKKFYPREWEHLVQMQKTYTEKDKFLLSIGKKARYKPLPPEEYFFSLPKVRNILSVSAKNKHGSLLSEEERKLKLEKLSNKRKSAIDKHITKITNNTKLLQKIDPHYVDFYIAAYHQKGIDIEGKMEIVKDLSKYDSIKIDTFFYKLNDSERNNQIRGMAFDYLQRTGKYAKLRKRFKGKKKPYMIETTCFEMAPEDLYKRLHSSKIQMNKSFDVFISHSYLDKEKIITLFKSLNEKGVSCYCDWTNDNDFLKRNMAGKYTEEVLKKRIQQSTYFLYADSDNSAKSKWVKFEIEYAKTIKKDIKIININNTAINDIQSQISNLLNIKD